MPDNTRTPRTRQERTFAASFTQPAPGRRVPAPQPIQPTPPSVPAPVVVTEHSPADTQALYTTMRAQATALPDDITNANYISTTSLFDVDSFYITGAVKAISTFDPTRECAHITVLVPMSTGTTDEWEECVWTPDLSPERARLVELFAKNPNQVIGPLYLEAVKTNKPNPYMKLVNLTAF